MVSGQHFPEQRPEAETSDGEKEGHYELHRGRTPLATHEGIINGAAKTGQLSAIRLWQTVEKVVLK